jgi:catechol 2,3-dioxygenase-like lactoylglutathione lyase family enzyme
MLDRLPDKEISMQVLGYTWAGVRAQDLKSTTRFFADVMGLPLIHESGELVQFELPSGQLFEVFGPKSRYYRLHACPVLAFQVADVRAAKEELAAQGVEFLTEVAGNESEGWAYFRGPDGYLYELWQTPRKLKALPLE